MSNITNNNIFTNVLKKTPLAGTYVYSFGLLLAASRAFKGVRVVVDYYYICFELFRWPISMEKHQYPYIRPTKKFSTSSLSFEAPEF